MSPDIKISVVVAIYNTEKLLERALDSLVGQSLQDIEIICVDNASTDRSSTIVREYMKRDTRIKAVFREKDKGLLASRREGALLAQGEYTMFVDSDDYLELNACEDLYRRIKKENVDILHFDAIVHAKQESLDYVKNYVKPHMGRIEGGKNIIKSCYVDREHCWLMWDKLFKSSLCKKAAAELTEKYVTYGEDMCYYFLLSYYAESYIGIESKKGYYHYFQGDGISGKKMGADWFHMVSSSHHVCEFLKEFLIQANQFQEYKMAWTSCYKVLATDVVAIWMQRVKREAKQECFDIMLKDWDADRVISLLAQSYGGSRADIAEWVKGAKTLAHTRKQVKTIGVFYPRLRFGGVERVMSILVDKWCTKGYRVVVFTDEKSHKDDYPIPSDVVRVVLPEAGYNAPEFMYERCAAIVENIKKYDIDAYVIHKWMNDELLWEIMAAKSTGAVTIVETHSTPACMVYENPTMFQPFMKTCALADGVVTLSKTDVCIMQSFGCKARFIPNPVAEEMDRIKPSSGKEQLVLWVGRVSQEKQPVEAARIMQELVKILPDVKLKIVGGPDGANTDDVYYEGVKKQFSARDLDKYVEFCGFQKEVYPYYEEASVLISTSLYEGFSMTILEGFAASLPCVVYDMPNLEFVRRGNGIFAVAPNHAEAAAANIAKLLTDRDAWKQASDAARKEYEYFRDYDIQKAWQTMFDMCAGCIAWEEEVLELEDHALAMKTLHMHHTWLLQKFSVQIDSCLNGPGMDKAWKIQKFSARFSAMGKKGKLKMLLYSFLRLFGIHWPLETAAFSVRPPIDNILWQMRNTK